MTDAAVGRMLVASLHQGIADLLPMRLEFYESWLNPSGLRDGKIGVAPLTAVLSFLRQEGESYRQVATRAGEYTAEWTIADLAPLRRAVIRAAPPSIRLRLALPIARRMVHQTFAGSTAVVHRHKERVAIDIRGSIFCAVRDRAQQPLCDFYVAAIKRMMFLFGVDVDIATDRCRATGAGGECIVSMLVRADART